MTKLLRFAGVALLALTIGVFGCDDDADPVAPTVTVPPTPTPPPPPLAAMMTPDAQTIGVGGTVVFAVSVSGGVAGEAASWTCASSDPSKATVSVVPVGCQATAVAVGGTSITAVVTKGGATTNAGAGLTITEDTVERAFLALALIEDGDDDAEVLSGNVRVTLNVERGDETLMQLSVFVDGVVAATLPFGDISAVVAAPQDEPAQQAAVHSFVLSFNSAGYDAVTGEPTYMNGERTISAELMVAGKDEPYRSGAHAREFDNDDGYIVAADLGDNSAIGDDGRQWYGGPGNGTIDITALPVSYSGGSVTSVSANFCGEDATDSDGADGYTFAFECEDRESNTDGTDGALVGDMLTLSSPGEAGVILNDDHPFPAFVDFMGPSESPIIVANRNGRENGWLNAAVALTGEVDDDDDDDENWLVKGEDETGGIGGYNMMLLMGDDLEKALEASPGSTLPAESAGADSYCAIASATDDLGNMSELPDDGAICRAAPVGADALVDEDNDPATAGVWGQGMDGSMVMEASASGQTLKFGVDVTAPTIMLGADDYDMRVNNIDELGAIAFEPEDDQNDVGNSGLHTDGLMVKAQRRNASKTECITVTAGGSVAVGAAADDDCEYTAITTEVVTVAARTNEEAYWTVSGMAQDQAGNSSDAVSHTFVYDNVLATATAPAVPAVIEAGKPFDGAVYVNDGLSIRDYYGTANYGTALSLGIGLPIEVDAFDASSLTYRNVPVSATVGIYTVGGALPPYLALQNVTNDNSPGTTVTAISGVSVLVRDQAQANYGEPGQQTEQTSSVRPTGVPEGKADELFGEAALTVEFVGRGDNGYDVCALPGGCGGTPGEDFPTSLKIEIRAIAPEAGTFSNPFERVDFLVMDTNGASWVVGSDASGTSGREGGDDDIAGNDRWRTWSYSVTLPGAMVAKATRPMTGGTGGSHD